MAVIDLRNLPTDEFVVHFGGPKSEIDALTLANSLIGISAAIQAISRQIQPEIEIEILVDATGPGSFRTKLRIYVKKAGKLFVVAAANVTLGVLASCIYDKLNSHKQEISVEGDLVIIQQGHDRIILPKSLWEQKERLPNRPEVDRHISKTFRAVQHDPQVTELGFLRTMHDELPFASIPRDQFSVLSEVVTEPQEGERTLDQEAALTVVKAVFQRSGRKWEFIWNGVKISAKITDPTFFDRLSTREIWFAQGDQMDAVLRIHQRFDELNRVYVNDHYEIVEVVGMRHAPRPPELPLAG